VQTNEVAMTGELAGIEPLRYTPAGVPVLDFRLAHRSQQMEAGIKRQVECELNGLALGEVAKVMAGLQPGQAVRIRGFLDRKNRMSAQLVLHATNAERIEESQHGDGKVRQTQGKG